MRRPMIVFTGALFVSLLTAGLARAEVVPVSTKPFLDKPARIVVHDAFSPIGSDAAGIITVNFDGQNLMADGEITHKGKPEVKITLRQYLGSLNEPWRYDFFEVRSSKGKVLGYFLAHPDVYDGFYLDEKGGYVIASGEFMGIGASGEDG